MGQCKKDVNPLLTHWSYVFLVLTHQSPPSSLPPPSLSISLSRLSKYYFHYRILKKNVPTYNSCESLVLVLSWMGIAMKSITQLNVWLSIAHVYFTIPKIYFSILEMSEVG